MVNITYFRIIISKKKYGGYGVVYRLTHYGGMVSSGLIWDASLVTLDLDITPWWFGKFFDEWIHIGWLFSTQFFFFSDKDLVACESDTTINVFFYQDPNWSPKWRSRENTPEKVVMAWIPGDLLDQSNQMKIHWLQVSSIRCMIVIEEY